VGWFADVLEPCRHLRSRSGFCTSSQFRTLAILILIACWFAQPAEGYRGKRRRPVSRPASLDVVPDAEVDARVADEVVKARRILEDLTTSNVLASPYLVSAFYYHDGFLNDFPVDRSSAAPERRIIGQISNLLTSETKARFVRLLREIWSRSEAPGPSRYVEPVAYRAVSGRRSHRYAIDLFAPEGTPVVAVSRGVVVLADRDWSPENLFSTTSRKGGDSVIVFDPDQDRFYRYCHLSCVKTSSGDLVAAGEHLGDVGHSGLNASRAGHGRHLHFETNEYSDGQVRAFSYQRLRTMLRGWRLSSSPVDRADGSQTKPRSVRGHANR
jgi:murein DD-endopeptidase MepM/ murein hydrolase activator NlpD